MLFRHLAVPRLSGTDALERVREEVVRQLREWGFSVVAQEFTTSDRRLQAVSAAGAGIGWWALIVGPLLVLPLPGWPVALIGFGSLGLGLLITSGIAQDRLPSGASEVRGVNIVARRGDPDVWLVAHLDSKAQRFSLAARISAVVTAALGGGLLLALLLLRPLVASPWWLVIGGVAASGVAGIVLSRSGPTNESSGAVDNATGVVAALHAARLLENSERVGLVITDAEELGMEGARTWAEGASPSWTFVNFDGIDGRGRFVVVAHEGGESKRGLGRERAETLVAALRDRGAPAVLGRLPPGVAVDGAVLAQRGLSGVTVCRGDWGTLKVVHTVRDSPERVTLGSALMAGEAAATTLRRFLG